MKKNIFLLSMFLINSTLASATIPDSFTQKEIRYQTFSGDCSSKSSGMMTLIVMKEFEKSRSLKDVKEKILAERLDEKFFLSDYRIHYNPINKALKISLECPRPLVKVQVYKSDGEEHYSAILGDNARLYEPQYENLMKAEGKLTDNLPSLAISAEQLEGDAPTVVTNFIKQMDRNLQKKISEIILSKNSDLTIVFGFNGKTTSVFMGTEFWDEKLLKLSKIVNYVGKNKRYPSSINLVNAKKVVVKFSDKI